jgi:hypothetical protein
VTCRIKRKHEKAAQQAKASQINTCQSGAFPTMTKEIDDQDKSPHVNMRKTGEEAQEKCPVFDDNLDFNADKVEIKEGYHIFMVMVRPIDPQHSFMLQAWCLDVWLKPL